MHFIDAHAHLNASVFNADRAKVIESAWEHGIKAIINCATEFNEWEEILLLSEKYSILKPALGVHPWYIPENYNELFKSIDRNIFKKVNAVGEIGLDTKFCKTDINLQKKVFTDFMILAKEFELPATVHCIGAFDELIDVIKKTGPFKNGIVLHAFNGSSELAQSLFKYNIYFSIGGIITFMDSQKRASMIKKIYPERMLLETDSPDIPVALKKYERNCPANIIFIANAAAEILNETIDKVAGNTTALAEKIFGV